MARLEILQAAPLTSIQDQGRFGCLVHGVSASGPMDRTAYDDAGDMLRDAGKIPGQGALEFAAGRLEIAVREGEITMAASGGNFSLSINSRPVPWNDVAALARGDRFAITPGPAGNYGILRFDKEMDIRPVLGSLSTNTKAGLGGLHGRTLRNGDKVLLLPIANTEQAEKSKQDTSHRLRNAAGPLRVIWGLHAPLFPLRQRNAFLKATFRISRFLDRMGVQLEDSAGIFADTRSLSLVSDPVVAGDIQILGNGTPVVLMRDHQPTGGYPRIATIISPDLDRFAQMRPGSDVQFRPVTVAHAHAILKQRKREQ